MKHQVLVLMACSLIGAAQGHITSHEYCIIGAGPAGLQLAHFFNQAGRDYIVFERANDSGSFFATYPRHRRLISINKRHTGRTNKEFNMRHDWNSLLSDDESLLFRRYSSEFFPHADTLVNYLRDFQQKLRVTVRYNTDIWNIRRVFSKSDQCHVFNMQDRQDNKYTCKTVIVATGIWKPNLPQFKGANLTVGYEVVPVQPEVFEGKNVLILGRGNSAFETADAIYGHTNLVHMISRSRARLSWSTHYVGDLRAINNGLLDTYQLKSLDGLLEAPVEDIVLEEQHGKIYVRLPRRDRDLSLANSTNVLLSESDLDNFSLREGYDYVIRCLGFHFDDSIFHSSTRPGRAAGRRAKYPAIKHNYESVAVPDLYFAGTLTHSLDFRKSAGGFIHGFRYTARSLHRLLEFKRHGVRWPSRKGVVGDLLNVVIRRINEAAGLYQMFSALADIITIPQDGSTFEIFEEFPVQLVHQFPNLTGHETDRIIIMIMEYGPEFSGPDKDTFRPDRATGDPLEAHRSNFLHPVFYYYHSRPTEEEMFSKPRGWILPRPQRLHHVLEDFLTTWTAPQSHILPLRRFLEFCIGTDLRNFPAEQCFQMQMTHGTVPVNCRNRFLNTRTIFIPEQMLRSKSADSVI